MEDFQTYTTARAKRGRRRRWLVLAPAVALLLLGVGTMALAMGGAGGGSTKFGETVKLAHGPRDTIRAPEAPDEPVNVLVVGVDRRPKAEAEGAGVRADTIMIARLFPETGQVRLLSVPRDLYVDIEPGVRDRINAAYAHGGISQTISALQNYTGARIDHYAIVDFNGFEAVIDAMGGVEVKVDEELPRAWKIEEGLQRLDGRQALLYARYRSTPGGDLDRIQRQQELMAALRSQALKWQSVAKIPRVVTAVQQNVSTDLGVAETLTLGRVFMRHGRDVAMTSGELRGIPETLPDGRQVLLPDQEANEAILRTFFGQ